MYKHSLPVLVQKQQLHDLQTAAKSYLSVKNALQKSYWENLNFFFDLVEFKWTYLCN